MQSIYNNNTKQTILPVQNKVAQMSCSKLWASSWRESVSPDYWSRFLKSRLLHEWRQVSKHNCEKALVLCQNLLCALVKTFRLQWMANLRISSTEVLL